jgi:hypothetical protein
LSGHKALIAVLCLAPLLTLQAAAQTHPHFDSAASKAAPCASSLAVCPTAGCGGGDKLLDTKKNISAAPSADYQVMSFDDFRHLESERPTAWKSGQSRQEVVDMGEGTPVMLTGFLLGAHSGSPETVNCKLSGEANNDYHINVVENDDDIQTASVVVEMTPKLRPGKANWTLPGLRTLPVASSKTHALVRVAGYLLFDSEHVSGNGGERMTIWEIHPVMRVEVCATGDCKPDTDDGWKDITAQ